MGQRRGRARDQRVEEPWVLPPVEGDRAQEPEESVIPRDQRRIGLRVVLRSNRPRAVRVWDRVCGMARVVSMTRYL